MSKPTNRSPQTLMASRSCISWENVSGWWCNNLFEKYEFGNGKDDIPYMKWKIKAMFQTTNQLCISMAMFLGNDAKWWKFHGNFEVHDRTIPITQRTYGWLRVWKYSVLFLFTINKIPSTQLKPLSDRDGSCQLPQRKVGKIYSMFCPLYTTN